MIIALFIQSYINISNLTDSKKKADMMSKKLASKLKKWSVY